MEQAILSALSAHGLAGIVIFGLSAYIWILHRDLQAERKERIDDFHKFTAAIVLSKEQTITALHTLGQFREDVKEKERILDANRGTAPYRTGGRGS